jgi:hypothetical protein
MTINKKKVSFLALNFLLILFLTCQVGGDQDVDEMTLQVYPEQVLKGLEHEQINFTLFLSSKSDDYQKNGNKIKIFFETNANYFHFQKDENDQDLGLPMNAFESEDDFIFYDLETDSNKTVSFNSSLIGIYYIRFYTEVNGIAGTKQYFDER